MNEQKFEYFLNAIHYGIWRKIASDSSNDKIVSFIWFRVFILFVPKKYRFKFIRNCKRREKESKEFLRNRDYGFCIGMANHWFGYLYSCYPMYFAFVILGLLSKNDIYLKGLLAWIVLLIPMALGYIPAYMAVFYKDRYLKYYKIFEKKDAKWHKKWKHISNAFCIGGILMFILGVATMIAIGDS